MAEEELPQIFLDKIKLAGMLIQKEMAIINNIHDLISMRRNGLLDLNRLQEYTEFHVSWQSLVELYDFLENGYLKTLTEDEQTKIVKIIASYMETDEQVSMDNLIMTYNLVRKMMTKSGFHDLRTSQRPKKDFLAPTTTW